MPGGESVTPSARKARNNTPTRGTIAASETGCPSHNSPLRRRGEAALLAEKELRMIGAETTSCEEEAKRPEEPTMTIEAAKPPPVPQVCGIPMRWVSLVLLTVHTTAQVFVIKWARREADRGEPYLSSTVVLLCEVVKTVVSFGLLSAEEGSVKSAAIVVVKQFSSPDALKVCIPSLLYTVQNNLMFYSLWALSAAVQQVTYQLKILTTALFSVMVLGKVLDGTKWFSLFLLLGGVLMVMWPRHSPEEKKPLVADKEFPLSLSLLANSGLSPDAIMGFAAVLIATVTSGFASVYLEKLLKQSKASIWLRNVQLGVIGTAMAILVAATQDGEQIVEKGLLQGYTAHTVCVVMTNALGGLLCAAVLKYADNILRCFSTALSIIITCMFSAMLREYTPDALFVCGASTAIASTFLYSLGMPRLEVLGKARTAVK